MIRRAGRRIPLPLAAILFAAALNVFLWSYATPPLQGPDESAHMAYVQHFAETGSPPQRLTSENATYSSEQAATMLYMALNTLPTVGGARPSWSPADERTLREALDALPASGRKDGTGPNLTSQNPPLYYAYSAVPYWAGRAIGLDFVGRTMLVRWASGLLYLATIALTWALVSQLLRATWLRVLATSLVALIPQLAFIGAIVNPDIMIVAIWTGFLALAVQTLRRGPTAWRVAGIGALAGASALAHGRGLLLAPPAAVVVALACWQHRVGWGPALRRAAGGLGLLALGGLTALLVTRSASGGAAFGGVASVGGGSASPTGFLSYLWQFYAQKLSAMNVAVGPDYGFRQVWVESFFGKFGSLDAPFHPRVYDGLQLLVAGGLLAFYTAAVVRRRWIVAHWQIAVSLAATPLALLGGLHLIAYRQLAAGSIDPVLQGRYLLPCVALVGLAGAAICASLPRRLGAALAGVLLALGVLLSFGGLGISVGRFYV